MLCVPFEDGCGTFLFACVCGYVQEYTLVFIYLRVRSHHFALLAVSLCGEEVVTRCFGSCLPLYLRVCFEYMSFGDIGLRTHLERVEGGGALECCRACHN